MGAPLKALRVNVPFARYVEMHGTNASFLKRLSRSPLHARANVRITGPSLELGSAAHCAVLEPERFLRDYVVWDRRTESGSTAPRRGKAWDEFVAANGEAEIVTADQHALATAIAAAVRADDAAMQYLRTGWAEVVVQWEINGRACKGRVDWMTSIDGVPVLVDLKTTADVRQDEFARSCIRFGYPMQMSWYADGVYAAAGRRPRVIVIAVEATAPHAVATYAVGEDVLDLGRSQYEPLLAQLDECERTNAWPGPVAGEQPLILPTWAWPKGGDDDWSDSGLEFGT